MLTHGTLVAGLALLGATVFIGSGLVSVILFARAKELKEAAPKRHIDSSDASEATGKLLESHEQPVFSVADRTTNLLPQKAEKAQNE